MKRIFILLLFTVLQSQAAEIDSQFWGTTGLLYKPSSTTQLYLETEARYYDQASHNKFNRTTLGLTWSARPWLSFMANYWRGSIKSDKWIDEQKPELAVNFKIKMGKWELSNRQKYEYRVREGAQNIHMYKTRAQICHSHTIFGFKCKDYLNDEIFYNATQDYTSLNRVRLGTEINLTRHLRPDLGLVFQSNNRRGSWDHVVALALKLNVVL